MPFGLGGGRSPYKDLERAPLSAQDDDDDDDDGMPLPPYSDAPPSPSKRRNGRNGNKPTNGRRNGANGSSSRRAIIAQDDNRGNGGYADDDDEDGDDDYEDSDGEDDYFHSGKVRYYRGGLICAYLKHWLTCQCCTCCAAMDGRNTSESRQTRRNIGGSSYGPSGENSKCPKCYTGVKRMVRALFFLFVLMVIVLCASAIGYIIAQDGSPFEPNETSISDANSNNGIIQNNNKLPPPPANLHEICTDWITETGRDKCQTECNAGSCCALPASDKSSCWEDQAAECATYRSACMALELHSNNGIDDGENKWLESGDDGPIPLPSTTKLDAPKPSYLDQICAPASLQLPTGFGQCSEVCRPSRCCHPETYGCEVASEDRRWCGAYEKPCAGVAESWRGSGHAVATTPSDGDTATTGATTTTATVENSLANQIVLECNSANLNPPDTCIEACLPGACCYVSTTFPPIEQLFDTYYGAANSPFQSSLESCASNIGFCQQFGSCEHLNHLVDTSGWHSDAVTYELDIANVCKAEYIAQFGALECSNVCQPAHCCFSGEYKCEDVKLGHLDCKDYSQCGVLYPSYKSTEELFQMAKHIDEVCSEESVGTPKGRSECQGLCKDRLCCFEDGTYGCANDPSQNCLAYAGCETLVSTSPSYFDNEKQPTVNTNDVATVKNNEGGIDTEVDDFITALEHSCSENSLKTLEGIQQCHNKCQTHLCCFTNDVTLVGNGNCENVHVEACSAYKPCERLVTPNAQNPLTASVMLDDIAENVNKACSMPQGDPYLVDQSWVTACHSVCASRLCCLVDAKIGSNCRAQVGSKECSAYGPCEVLINKSDGQEIKDAKAIEDKFGDIDSVCSSGVGQNAEQYDECEERCTQRSCCFEDVEAYSCYTMEKDWCDEFKACSFVDFTFAESDSSSGTPNSIVDVTTTSSTTQIAAPTTISNSGSGISNADKIEHAFKDLCSENNIDENLATCKDHCSVYECCFKGGGNSCYSKKKLECDEYYICEKFFTDEEEEAKPDDVTTTSSTTVNNVASPTASPFKSEVDDMEVSFETHCTPSKILQNWDICKGICSGKECCFRDVDSCYQQNRLACDEFYICEEFFTDEKGGDGTVLVGSTNPAPKFDAFQSAIEAACSPDSLRTLDGIELCYNKCQAHLCCVSTDALSADFDCSDTYPDECNAYYVCENLVSQYNLWTPPSTSFDPYAVKIAVNDVCILPQGNVPVTEEWVGNCHQVCEERMCCLAHSSLGSNCVEILGGDECADYSACKVLIGGEERDTKSIDDLCNSEVSSSDVLFSDCREECKSRSCCFETEPAYSCYAMEEEWCNEYKSCELVGFTFLGGATANAVTTNTPTIKTNQAGTTTETLDFEQIDSKCSKEYLLAFGLEECEYLCESVKCCYDFTQCTYPNPSDCEKASSCDNFFSPESEDLIIEKLCSEEELEANERPCHDACDPYECCFNDSSCSSSIIAQCPRYEPCRNYFETFKPDSKVRP